MYLATAKQTPFSAFLGVVMMFSWQVGAQDTRSVSEPSFPASCTVLHAHLATADGGRLKNDQDNDTSASADTAMIQAAMETCAPGKAVELSLGPEGQGDAFLINPIRIPAGVSIIVDGGVSVFGSRNPENYQVPGVAAVCGVVSMQSGGCKPLLSFAEDSGLYGYGVLDGRGYGDMLAGASAGKTWWNNTLSLKPGQSQNIPVLVAVKGNNFTAYKITLRNAPYYCLQWTGDGLTVWGITIQSPWDVPNTDGINIWGTNATVKDTTISEGDDQIAIDAREIPAADITIDHVTGYGRNGLSIGSGIAKGVSNVLITNSNLTGGVVSVHGTAVNGMLLAEMEKYGVIDYTQALPTRSTKIRGLNIKTRPIMGGSVDHVIFSNICMKDLNIPIEVAPYFGMTQGGNFPTVTDIIYKNIHVIAPDDRSISRYAINLLAYVPLKRNDITFDNLVFDDMPSGESSVESITASNNVFSTKGNLYPEAFSELGAIQPEKKSLQGTRLTLASNSYALAMANHQRRNAYSCSEDDFPFAVGGLYLSVESAHQSNLHTASLPAGVKLTLNAILQPAMSGVTYFAPHGYGVQPGLLAVGAPAFTMPITFYRTSADGKTSVVGSASLRANGTLASFSVSGLKRGTYQFSAAYPGDTNYRALQLGTVVAIVK